MPTRQEHYRKAEALLLEGEEVVRRISAMNDQRMAWVQNPPLVYEDRVAFADMTDRMDEYGKKAMGIWAQAQVHATLAHALRAVAEPDRWDA